MIQSFQQNPVNHALLPVSQDSDFRAETYKWSWIVLIVAALYQGIFHVDMVTLIAVFCVILGWAITSRLFLGGPIMSDFPFSSFVFPLIFTSMEGKPLVYNLELPEQVFLHSLAGLVTLALAHALYRFLVRISYKKPFQLMRLAGFFTPPTESQLWLMGMVGLACNYYVFFVVPEIGEGVTVGTALDKVIQGLAPFSYAPFFILVGKLYGKVSKPSPMFAPLLVVFTIALFALSIGRNSRGAFMIGFTSLAFAYIIGLLMGVYKSRFFTIRNAFFVGILFWLLTGPMADLGTAMVIVRGEREDVPPGEMIDLTLEAYSDKNAIRERRIFDLSSGWDVDWDERYLDNVFTTRFANLKFNDMSLVMAAKLDEYDPDMLNYAVDYVLTGLPDPVLKAFNFNIDKEQLLSMSIGDYFYMISGGQGVIQGFRSGHLAGTGMATFGWWYLPILGASMILIFILFDLFFERNRSTDDEGGRNVQFSCCGLFALTSMWYFLPSESLVTVGTFLIRGWLQLAFLYMFMFYITWLVTGGFRIRFKWGS
jgi:hypothetical protein